MRHGMRRAGERTGEEYLSSDCSADWWAGFCLSVRLQLFSLRAAAGNTLHEARSARHMERIWQLYWGGWVACWRGRRAAVSLGLGCGGMNAGTSLRVHHSERLGEGPHVLAACRFVCLAFPGRSVLKSVCVCVCVCARACARACVHAFVCVSRRTATAQPGQLPPLRQQEPSHAHGVLRTGVRTLPGACSCSCRPSPALQALHNSWAGQAGSTTARLGGQAAQQLSSPVTRQVDAACRSARPVQLPHPRTNVSIAEPCPALPRGGSRPGGHGPA